MKIFGYLFVYLIIMVQCQRIYGQDTLRLDDYLFTISQHYPLIKKANIYDEFVESYKLQAKGVLDPALNSNLQQKRFSGTDYFTVWESAIKIPTRLPVDFSLGHEQNQGLFLNPERNVPNQGLLYGTLNVSLLRGLMFDEQRYQIRLADLKGIKSQIDKDLLIREILIQAINAYIDWAASFYKKNVYEDNLAMIEDRHRFIVQLVENGDKAPIDTIESTLNINTASKAFMESRNELMTKRQKLDVFLWDDQSRPLSLNSNVVPSSLQDLVIELNGLFPVMQPDFMRDPLVQKIQNEIDQLALKNTLEKENLKPQLDVKYNTIVNLGKEDFDPAFSFNDYKYGIQLGVPIRNRKTKSKIQLNDWMIEQSKLDQQQYEQALLNKYEALSFNRALQEEINLVIQEKIDNSQLILEAELMKFNLGESSVFLLNKRQEKLLEAQMDLIKSRSQLSKYLSELYFLWLGQSS